MDVVERGRPRHEFAQDQRGPPRREDLRCLGYRAELAVSIFHDKSAILVVAAHPSMRSRCTIVHNLYRFLERDQVQKMNLKDAAAARNREPIDPAERHPS